MKQETAMILWIIMAMCLLIAVTMTSGCSQILTAREAREMSPEQIKAYAEQQMDVYQCANISGPPPSGGMTFMVVPKHAKLELAFGNNCSLLTGKVLP